MSFMFTEFVVGLAQISSRESDDRRLQFIFRIYDMDRDGYISNGELFQVKLFNFSFFKPNLPNEI